MSGINQDEPCSVQDNIVASLKYAINSNLNNADDDIPDKELEASPTPLTQA